MSAPAKKKTGDVAALLQDSAAKFLSAVEKKFDLKLDYSEPSLYAVDFLLTLFFKERRGSDLAASLIGSYLGEVVIKNLGGKWNPEDASVVKIGRMKGVAYPFRQAKNRLQKGLGEACTAWYAGLKMKFCLSGELQWHGNGFTTGIYSHLVSQGWDLRLLSRILDDGEKPYIREEAAHVLRELKSERVAQALADALDSEDQIYFACIALQGVRHEKALPALRHICCRHEEVAVRIQAIQALGAHGDHDSVSLLFEMLEEEEEIIAHYASQALAKIGGDKTLQSLLEILKNGSGRKKILALSALELIGNPACIPYLIECLFDRNDEVREAATRALQYIPDQRALGPLLFLLDDRSSRIRILAGYALAFIGDQRALDRMKRLLKDPVKDVRDHASYLIPLIETGKTPAGFCW